MRAEIITVEKRLHDLGLADSYFFFGSPAVAMQVDKKTGKWKVYLGEIDDKAFDHVIMPTETLELSFDEGVGAIKVLRKLKLYGFGFVVKERGGRG